MNRVFCTFSQTKPLLIEKSVAQDIDRVQLTHIHKFRWVWLNQDCILAVSKSYLSMLVLNMYYPW